ncbi:MAG TPA: hypothetical protein V6D30_09475 [Leptolyngbyaceae cyanobacterium]|jgi:hypothetical protein
MEVDRVPVSQLPSRYGIARSALYTRLKDLKIEPEKQGKKAFVNASQLQRLDALHEHIQKGGTTGEFLKQFESPVQLPTEDSPGQSRAIVQDSPGQITTSPPAALVAVVEAVVKRLMPTPTRLSHLRELEEAYSKGWLLSTSELADLLGLAPGTITDYGEEFNDAGFTFTRAGKRKGGEIAWLVHKINLPNRTQR